MNDDNTTGNRIDAHQDAARDRLEGHVARSEQRLSDAVAKTSEVIGKTARFAADHTPDVIGTRIEGLAARAQEALDKPVGGEDAPFGGVDTPVNGEGTPLDGKNEKE